MRELVKGELRHSVTLPLPLALPLSLTLLLTLGDMRLAIVFVTITVVTLTLSGGQGKADIRNGWHRSVCARGPNPNPSPGPALTRMNTLVLTALFAIEYFTDP